MPVVVMVFSSPVMCVVVAVPVLTINTFTFYFYKDENVYKKLLIFVDALDKLPFTKWPMMFYSL